MPLINCPECSGTVSTEAVSCPHCGYQVSTTSATRSKAVVPQQVRPSIATETSSQSRWSVKGGFIAAVIWIAMSAGFLVPKLWKPDMLLVRYTNDIHPPALFALLALLASTSAVIFWLFAKPSKPPTNSGVSQEPDPDFTAFK